jgi:hypothetical protein
MKFRIKTLTSKTKIIAFRGKESVRANIVLDSKILEQARNFNHLDCSMVVRDAMMLV